MHLYVYLVFILLLLYVVQRFNYLSFQTDYLVEFVFSFHLLYPFTSMSGAMFDAITIWNVF